MGEEQSEPSAGNSAPSVAAKRAKTASRRVQENAEGSAPSKPNLMRDSDALLTLLGEIIHGDPDCLGILLKNSMTKVLFKLGLLGPLLASSTATPRQRRANAGAAHRILRRRIRRILRHRIS